MEVDDGFQKSYDRHKMVVKRWEREFTKLHGRIPSKYDIKEASSEVRRSYSRYFHLKSSMLEGALRELHFSPEKNDGNEAMRRSPSFSPLPYDDEDETTSMGKLPTVAQIQNLVEAETSSKIWGEHLNKARKSTAATVKPQQQSSLPQMSHKLFSNGCSFNKRNPRKLLSRSSLSQSSQSLDDSSQKDAAAIVDPISTSSIDYISSSVNVSEAMPSQSVRKIDSKWVERCMDNPLNDADSTFEALFSLSDFPSESEAACSLRNSNDADLPSGSSYGLRNFKNVETLSVPVVEDCIENSESEDDSQLNYSKIKPIVKRTKLDESVIKANESLESLKSDEVVQIENKKKRTTRAAPKQKGKKNVKIPKKSRKTVVESENELDTLYDDHVEMPRVLIDTSALNETNIIDGLVKALKCPGNAKRKPQSKRRTDSVPSTAEEKLQSKIKSGSLNDNFVRINIEKKVFVRGKKTVNYSKMKKQQWKKKKKALNELGPEFPDGGVLKCFKCDQVGHMARYCTVHRGKDLLPLNEIDDNSEHQTLKEVEEAQKTIEKSLEEQNFFFKSVLDKQKSENVELKQRELVPDTFLKLLAAQENKVERSPITKVEPLYTLNPDGSVPDTPTEVSNALTLFGHEEFRPGQLQAIMRILSGKSTLLTLSTGSGKSLCYQLPAYVYSQRSKCITLVVSPLVSLMEDQVLNMPSFVKAACLHTNQSPTQREKIIELIKSGMINILLVSPEAIVSGERSSGFGSILRQLPPVAFVCIDEVHCVSQWSHNFRPSYLTLCRVLREKLKVDCILGLTATATTATMESIIDHIGITDGLNGVIKNLPIPDNLILTVSRDALRDKAILELLLSERFVDCQSIIVYCIRRDECERIAGLIRTSLPGFAQPTSDLPKSNRKRKRFDWLVEAYHAGMSAAKRRNVQQAFMNGDLKIVVATVAFGMGINKSDIRAVIHYNMPSSFESYVQEIGRAGRDGQTAQCHTFIDREGKDKFELLRHIHANSVERYIVRKLLQKVFIPCQCRTIDKTKDNECQGHEVAFPVEETVRELDLPAENICTLLCYLELHDKKHIKMLSNVYTMCKIVSYGGSIEIFKAAQRCPPLAMAIALEKNKGKSMEGLANFEFCAIDVAAAIGWQSGLVKYHLKNLEWDGGKKSMLRVEFHTLGFRIMAPGDLDPTELDAALDSLYERTRLQERKMTNQLLQISSTLTRISHPSIVDCVPDVEKSDYLKACVQEYFLKGAVDVEEQSTMEDNRSINESQIVSDIRGLISSYRDCTFTGRAVARIFHGISSPNFPALVWGRCRYWRLHIGVDFYKISEIAKQQIISMR